ncbi:YtxH domain-containing protein [Clostridium felsineum]|uniref:Uncharacterized protein n=1 Tax=Clostridium felsineum TaxID=36839 RepID=A0A1S8LQB2_9CLOT|nr:YtxH domain-containing protein [Clostridium felsineum]MCR3761760.1 YtxH domain-containing protein [Clostridium felsineum]URZ01408.1 hypothetical protein CLAUR_014030 [Clostridium felsineum]URZ05747.1 hypothetical protein CLROS_010730 [Clostridium felsineum]URZ10786.1 hypothetical protein CROST_014960 [Clostridium felsineum]
MKSFKGITTGAVIGAVTGMIIAPQLSKNAKKKIRKSGRMIRDTAEDLMDSMKMWSK